MKIALVHASGYPAREGIGFYVDGLARALVDRGHDVQAITRGGLRGTVHVHADGYLVRSGPYLPIFPVHVHLQGLLLRRYFDALSKEVDVFHLHSPLVPVPRTRRPVVATVHTPMRTDTRALEPIDPLAWLARAQAPVSMLLERALLKRANAITTVSEGVATELGAYGVPRERVTTIGNATDTRFFGPDGASPTEPPSVLYAGRLGHRKGLYDLLAAFVMLARRHATVRLRLAGAGPLTPKLRARVRRNRLDNRVTFLGHVLDRSRLRAEYRRASVYVQASHYEGLPTSLLEAMSCARPVVATAIPGHVDVVRDGRTGRLVPPRDPEALARVLAEVLADSERAARMGAAARAVVCRDHAWPRLAERFENVYAAVTP